MDSTLFESVPDKRRQTPGGDCVHRNFSAADKFTRPFQDTMTAWCWGFGWGDEMGDAETRFTMDLAMPGAPGKGNEWEIQFRGDLSQGVPVEEIRNTVDDADTCCGAPQAGESLRAGREAPPQNGHPA